MSSDIILLSKRNDFALFINLASPSIMPMDNDKGICRTLTSNTHRQWYVNMVLRKGLYDISHNYLSFHIIVFGFFSDTYSLYFVMGMSKCGYDAHGVWVEYLFIIYIYFDCIQHYVIIDNENELFFKH